MTAPGPYYWIAHLACIIAIAIAQVHIAFGVF
jgi:hypothetical protein